MYVTEDLRNTGVDINITGLLKTDLKNPDLLAAEIMKAVSKKAREIRASQ